MAQPTNTFSSYDAVGNREDLSDIINLISPTETPFLSSIGKGKASSTLHEWQKDSLAAADGANFVIEGDDATADAISPTTRVSNYCAISDKVAVVTGTQESVSKAGRKSEMAREMKKKMQELKRDIETILLQNSAKSAGSDTAARKVGGLQAYVTTNTSIGGTAVAATGDGSDAHTAGTARVLTESMFEDVLSQCWEQGGTPTMAILNAFQKRKAAAFSGNSTKNLDSEDRKVVNSVDVYIDPLGNEVRLVPDRFAPTNAVFFVDPEYVKFATLRDFQTHDLAKTGDTLKKQILVEYTLQVGNEAAHGGIYDLTTA